jgi:hypothetical protein
MCSLVLGFWPRLATVSAAVAVLLPATVWGAAVESPAAIYDALRAPTLDGRSVAVEGLLFREDAIELRLESGRLHLFEAVDGRTYGGVFLGEGELALRPATEGERALLALRDGDPRLEVLRDRFDVAVLLWSAATTPQRLGAATDLAVGQPDERARRAAETRLRDARTSTLPLHPELRVSRAAANDEGHGRGVLLAYLSGGRRGKVVVATDPLGVLDAEEVALVVEEGIHAGYWYSSHYRDEVESGRAAGCRKKLLVDVEHYVLDTGVRGVDLEGNAEVTFTSQVPSLRLLPFDLLPTLRVASATLADGAELRVVQGGEREGGAAILLPRALARGERLKVRLGYAGKGVLHDDGVGTYRVEARTNWYPSLGGFQDRATYDLHFRVPKDSTVIAVGKLVETTTAAGETRSSWRVDRPVSVAGFNYGKFVRTAQLEPRTGIEIEVYASAGTPNVIAELNQILGAAQGAASTPQQVELANSDSPIYLPTYTGPGQVGISKDSLTRAALADATNSVQVFTALFGPLPFDRLAITQQAQWTFGQAWPTLVFLPYLSALSGVTRMELGLGDAAAFVEQVGIHEVAHQWWGHGVGWASYRDQWLSEGFAELSTALLLELQGGPREYDKFFEARRRLLLGGARGVKAVEAAPISAGFRAETARSPGAYQALVYGKGAFVLHMPRALMREQGAPQPDQRFLALLRDFATTFAGRDATTEDFEAVVARHMVPALDAAGNGSPKWFFDQWVRGTALPRYQVDVKIEKAKDGGKDRYRLVGTMRQSEVPDDFVALVPVYVDLGGGELAQFGRSPFRGNMERTLDVTLELPRKPRRVVLAARHEVLARD